MTWPLERMFTLAAAMVFALFFIGGCTSYPDCNDDEGCEEQGEFCKDGKCAECRADSHCKGVCNECNGGKCERVANCCTSKADCDKPKVCENNQCEFDCLVDGDCEDGWHCEEKVCIKGPECSEDKPCADGYNCEDGSCIKIQYCQMKPVFFDFDESKIKKDARDDLTFNLECYNTRTEAQGAISVKVTGHCDDRGTEEYNMALGEDRAKATIKHLKRLGISKGNMSQDSRGEYSPKVRGASSESEHAQNRRSEFTVTKQ